MTTLLQNSPEAQEAKVTVELTARQAAELFNLLKAEVDFGEGLSPALEGLRRELREAVKALGLTFREGYAHLG